MKRTTLQVVTGFPLFALLALGVAHGDPGSASETRNVSDFRGIDLAGVIDADVTLGKPFSVVVSGEADLLSKVITRIDDGVLVIKTKSKLPRNTHLHASVTAPDLASVSLSGVGDLKVTGVSNHELTISLSGVGSLSATGSTASLHVVSTGTGDIAAKSLAAKKAVVEMSGVGQTTLQATQALDAQLTGVGSIDVYGKPPQVKKSRTGIGDITIH